MRNDLILKSKGLIRQIAVVLFTMCFLLLSSEALAAPTEKEMKEKAYQVLKEQLALEKIDVTYNEGGKYTGVEDNISIWHFSFLLKEHPEDEYGYVAVEFSLDGTLLSVHPSQKMPLEDQFFADFTRQAYPYAMGELFELKQKWEPHLEEIEKAVNDPTYYIHKYIRVLRLQMSHPTEENYPLESARQKAREVILNLPGWTEEKLNMYSLYLEIFYESDEIEQPIYQFIHSRESPFYGRFANETVETYDEVYIQPLYALFGGINDTTPWYVSVRLDGETGELLEEPLIVFPPVVVDEWDTLR